MPSTPSSAPRLVLTVVATCAIAATGLSFTHAATADRIAEQERRAVRRALTEVLGSSESAVEVESVDESVLSRIASADPATPVEAVFRMSDLDGEMLGWGIAVAPRGYGGPVRMIVGLDSAGSVTGVKVVSHRETPGLGDKVVESRDHLAGYAGIDSSDAERAVKEIDAVTGATKSSRSVRDGVLAAARGWRAVLSEEQSR